jgi:hypothetical protein
MKSKALGSLRAAQLLINSKEEQYCTASIHCSYYAVFQYMKYMLAHTDKNPISYTLQSDKTKGKDSHEYIIEQIKLRIPKPYEARDFAQDFRVLKNDRVAADYDTRQFDIEESLECKQRADRLITKLKTYFGDK